MEHREQDQPDAESVDPTPDAPAPDDALAAAIAERDDMLARLQRVSADYLNYQKRAEHNLRDAIDLARADVLRQFIPVLDHFNHALETAPDTAEAKKVYEGVRIVRDELLKTLQHGGVTLIEPKVGEAFDPHRHEAMLRQPAEGVEPGHIAMVFQPGYQFGPRTLRAAKVAVVPNE